MLSPLIIWREQNEGSIGIFEVSCSADELGHGKGFYTPEESETRLLDFSGALEVCS